VSVAEGLQPEQIESVLLPKLRTDRVTYFPVRHHSPACAIHIERWILKHKPMAVLVEGPSSFTPLIERLTDERTVSPIALFTNFIDKKDRLKKLFEAEEKEKSTGTAGGESGETGDVQPELPGDYALDLGPARYAAYYPFCDYSPELVALRTGRSVGARLKFIDLEYGEMILNQFEVLKERPPDFVYVDSLAQDPHLKHSDFIKELSRKLGCRGFDELWDHLFEACREDLSTDSFIDRLATYCALARLDYSEYDLRRDGTTAREACMASHIVEELEKNDGPILVVTGGFHTAALPELVERKVKRPRKVEFADDEVGVWLMRYSFDRLDALAGYSAGMPSPAFYDRVWNAEKSCIASGGIREEAIERVAAEILVEISRTTRERKLPNLITTPDAIAAAQMTKQLAALRGHAWPMREDILDGIRSCFIKGEVGIEGQALIRLVNDVLAGDRVGQIPPGGELPPIVDDFYREAKRFRFVVDRVEKREHALDLYRNANHRSISRLFHRLNLIGVPFARFVAGPDFVSGLNLDLVQEHWESSWSPVVESSLIEASVYGTTIEEAATTRLKQQIAALDQEAQGRSTSAAVTLLVRACRLGLHAQSHAMVPLIDVHIAEDPMMPSVVSGLSQLELLQNAREPLEAFELTALPRLMLAAYQRACHLIYDVAHCPAEMVEQVLHSLQMLREILSSSAREESKEELNVLDDELFFKALNAVIEFPPHESQSVIVGAAAGILYGEGRMTDADLIRVVCGYLGGAVDDPRKSAGILRGLLTTACEIAWQVSAVLSAIDEQFQSWDEELFLEALPELRLAFSILTPRDVSRVAEKVAELHEGESLGELVHMDIGEDDVQFGLAMNERVRLALLDDGLSITGNAASSNGENLSARTDEERRSSRSEVDDA